MFHFTLYDAYILFFILIIIALDWMHEKKKHGAESATMRTIFGFVMFALFYGVWKALWWVSGYALVALVCWMIWDRVSKKLALIIAGSMALISFVSYLAFRYSWLIFIVVALLFVGQWLLISRNLPKKN